MLFHKIREDGNEREMYTRKTVVCGHVAGGFPLVVTRAALARACHFPRIADFGAFVVHPFPELVNLLVPVSPPCII